MRSVVTTSENNLIKIHFSMLEMAKLSTATEEESLDVKEEVVTNCQGGVCALNWSPKRSAKNSEAA